MIKIQAAVSERRIFMSFVKEHGKLRVVGTKIVDKEGKEVVLKGVSTHGIQWYDRYINEESFLTLRDEWGVNLIRLAMYTEPEKDESEPMPQRTPEEYNKFVSEVLERGVEIATKLGMYVMIDWHILFDGNPNKNKDKALEFFDKYVRKYKEYDNVLYEICNEPNGDVLWSRDVKPYAMEVIKHIRSIDKESIIIVGTPNWSQDVDIASLDRIEGYENIMYTVHFYASTHTELFREKVRVALSNELPLFISEFSICDATGDGVIDMEEAEKWMDIAKENDISFAIWALSNKKESASLIKDTCDKTSRWTKDELSVTGNWFIDMLKRKYS